MNQDQQTESLKNHGIKGKSVATDEELLQKNEKNEKERMYRRSTNLACGGAKTFSHPPYSQYGFIYFQTESCFRHFGGFDMAPPSGFLNFYLEPPNLPPFIPK